MKQAWGGIMTLVIAAGCGGLASENGGRDAGIDRTSSRMDSGMTDGPQIDRSPPPFDTAPPPFDTSPLLDVAPTPESGGGDVSAGCIPPPSGVVSWWTADSTFADVEGLNPGSPDGTVSFAKGVVGDAFVLDGTSDVSAMTNSFPVGAADRTVELWASLSTTVGSVGSRSEMFAQYGTPGTGGAAFELFTWSIQLNWSQWGGSFAGGLMSVGVWTHVAFTSKAGAMTLFQNGKAVASDAVAPYDTAAGTRFYMGGVGAEPPGGAYDHLQGMVDEVTVYDRALSGAEIASIYAAGSAGKCR